MRKEQRGTAIVLAMGIVALAATAAATMVAWQSVWARQNQLVNEYVQARVMVQAGVDWIRAVLNDDRLMSTVDHLGEPWAMQMPPMPIERGRLTGSIDDQQGLFNLNNLVQDGKVSTAQLGHFKRLLELLDLPVALAEDLVDWIDADGIPQTAGGAEDEYYLRLNPPSLAANRPLTDMTELARVRGFNSATRARLRPFVTALPPPTVVNVNTAPPEVLAAVTKNLGIGNARMLVAQRARLHFRDQTDFLSRLPQGVTAESSDIDVNSGYFMARLQVTIGEARAQGVVLLARTEAGWPAIVWRKYL